MNQTQLKNYLAFESLEKLIAENKVLGYLYAAFTLLFIDVHIFVKSLYKIKPLLCFSIMIVLTVLMVAVLFLSLKNNKSSVFRLHIIQGADFTLIAVVWFCIILIQWQCGVFKLNKGHLITLGVMILMGISVIIYRVYRLYNNGCSKKSRNALYSGIGGIGFCLAFILSKVLEQSGEEISNLALSHACIVVFMCFLTVGIVVFFNAFIIKKYKFMAN